MLLQVGVWIDYRRALVVLLDGDSVQTKEILSGIESRVKSTGGFGASFPWWHRSVRFGGRWRARRDQRMHGYFTKVFRELVGIEAPLIFGPGMAKGAFSNFLADTKGHRPSAVVVQSCGSRLSDAEIIDLVRTHFHRSAPRQLPTRSLTAGNSSEQGGVWYTNT